MTVGITELPPEGMQLPGVALAGDAERGTKTTEGISLLFTTAGITVQGPQPQIERLLVWTALDSAVCRETINLPDGRSAAIMELTSGGQAIRFLLPADAVSPGQAAYLDQALPAWLARYKGVAAPVAPGAPVAPVAPGLAAMAPTVTEPASGPDYQVTAPAPAPAPAPRPTVQPAPSFATAGAAAAGVVAGAAAGAASPGRMIDRSPNGSANGQTAPAPVDPTAAAPAAPAAPADVAPVVTTPQAPEVTSWDEPPLGQPATPSEVQAKPSRISRGRRKAETAATAATAAVVADAALAPPITPPSNPVPLAVQPPPPLGVRPVADPAAISNPIPPGGEIPLGQDPVDGASGDGLPPQVVLADSSKRSKHNTQVVLVVLLVLVMLAGAGFLVAKGRSTTTSSAPSTPVTSASADTFLAGSVNLGLADLPTGWTQPSPAQAVVRPLVAPAVAHADATNAMAACLNTNYAVISGLFDSGSLPDQTSLVESPVFQSAAGSSFEMASRTATLASPGQVQALNAIFTNPKFTLCYQQFQTALAAAAVAGSTAQVQPVTLTGPGGVQAYGAVTTYTVPGAGTEVVGSAFVLGGRVVTVITPSTNGAPIDAAVFTAAFNSVAGRVAAAASK